MDKDCDHVIGIADKNTLISHYVSGLSEYPSGWFDRPYGYRLLFSYCPLCGEKIDWVKVWAENKRNQIRDIIGKWPGDETDAEFDELMREHEERD